MDRQNKLEIDVLYNIFIIIFHSNMENTEQHIQYSIKEKNGHSYNTRNKVVSDPPHNGRVAGVVNTENKKAKVVIKEECIICANTYNKSNRLKLNCLYCNYEACRECNETYLLGETVPKCMNMECGKEWTRKYLAQNFTKTFLHTSYKKHVQQILFDKERSLMPDTQTFVRTYMNMKKMEEENRKIEEQILKLNEDRLSNNARLYRLREYYFRNPEFGQDENMDDEGYYENERNAMGTGVSEDDDDDDDDGEGNGVGEGSNIIRNRRVNSTTRFVRACPDENCRGFLSSQWKCGVCNQWTCSQCHELKGMDKHAEHTCEPDKVATATLLMKDTKPCPKCQTGIFKIDGCDQMWCTQCHTAFSWKTGKTEKTIHNPHYYEWLRIKGENIEREDGDEIGHCLDLANLAITLSNLNDYDYIPSETGYNYSYLSAFNDCGVNLEKLRKDKKIALKDPLKLLENLFHLRETEISKYTDILNESEFQYRHMRVQYMLNRMNEATYLTHLQQHHKKVEKAREYRNVLELFVNASLDILGRFCEKINQTPPNYDVKILLELIAIRKYVNECLVDISETYHCVCLRFDIYFKLEKNI